MNTSQNKKLKSISAEAVCVGFALIIFGLLICFYVLNDKAQHIYIEANSDKTASSEYCSDLIVSSPTED